MPLDTSVAPVDGFTVDVPVANGTRSVGRTWTTVVTTAGIFLTSYCWGIRAGGDGGGAGWRILPASTAAGHFEVLALIMKPSGSGLPNRGS